MVKKPSLSYYLLLTGGRIVGFIPYPKVIRAMWNENSIVPGLNSDHLIDFNDDHYSRITSIENA